MKSTLCGASVSLLIALVSSVSAHAEDKSDLSTFLKTASENVTLSGLIEVEGFAGRDFEEKDSSDVTLATAQLGLDAELAPWASGHLLFLYEEDGTDGIEVDEGTITLGGSEAWPAYLTVGQMYVPFGVFESSMISDPFTLEMGETNQSAILVGFRSGGFHARGYGFNCDVDELGDEDSEQIECFGAAAGYSKESEESLSFQVEAGYISNFLDTDGFEDHVTELNLESLDREGGYNVFAKLSYGAFTLLGEVVSGLGDLEFSIGTREKPLAWNTEFNYALSLLGKDAVVAVGYQATDNMAALLPKTRVLGSASVAVVEGLSAGLEYAHDKDYKESEGGTDNSADTVTMQLALEF